MKQKHVVVLMGLGLLVFQGPFVTGCNKETDPHAKVEAPGYYNGPMKPTGANAAGGKNTPAGTSGPDRG